jgi:hypothetical protein
MDWLKTKNYPGCNRKYKINHDFFKTWSHDMAYVLGFWWADGWICTNGYRCNFGIAQHKSREAILKKILRKMKSNYPIFESKYKICQFLIRSKSIVKDIISLGGMPRKSLTIGFPDVPKPYLPDFIRGHFDGDGCIYKSKNKKANKNSKHKFDYQISIASGSKIFINKLLIILRENISGFGGQIQERIPCKKFIRGKLWKQNGPVYILRGRTNDARRLQQYMYSSNKSSKLKLLCKYKLFDGIGEIKNEYLKTKFLSMKEAKKIATEMKFKNNEEWRKYARNNKSLPINPQMVYKKEWYGWEDFLGYNKRNKHYVEAKRIRQK